jgi:hypothetical protein
VVDDESGVVVTAAEAVAATLVSRYPRELVTADAASLTAAFAPASDETNAAPAAAPAAAAPPDFWGEGDEDTSLLASPDEAAATDDDAVTSLAGALLLAPTPVTFAKGDRNLRPPNAIFEANADADALAADALAAAAAAAPAAAEDGGGDGDGASSEIERWWRASSVSFPLDVAGGGGASGGCSVGSLMLPASFSGDPLEALRPHTGSIPV